MSERSKAVVITGASQGIGAGIVRAYRELGYSVVASSRSIAPSDDPQIVCVAGDIGDPATGPRLVAEALEHFGRVDTLVNNAGIFIGGPFTRYTAEQYQQVVATNLNGFFFTTQAAITAMEKQGSGHVVNITASLENANAAIPAILAHLTKGGLDFATRGLAIEYATRGIRVNAVAPGVIKTPMHAAATHAALGALHPIGRMGEVSEVVEAVLYLETAAFVTGETLHVDGGQSAGH
jgi:NAD(P)-dependent dehydrogenase (short-subunit alcohol dehydrogenase family)